MVRHLGIWTTALCWLTACAGDGRFPAAVTQNKLTTPSIVQAANATQAAINKCRAGMEAAMRHGTSPRLVPDDKPCWDHWVQVVLAWKGAAKTDGTWALDDVYYQTWIASTIQASLLKAAKDLALSKRQQAFALARLYRGFNDQFLPAAQRHGALTPSDVTKLADRVRASGPSLQDFSWSDRAPGYRGGEGDGPLVPRKYAVGFFH